MSFRCSGMAESSLRISLVIASLIWSWYASSLTVLIFPIAALKWAMSIWPLTDNPAKSLLLGCLKYTTSILRSLARLLVESLVPKREKGEEIEFVATYHLISRHEQRALK